MDGLYAGILRAATAEDTISAICGAPPSEVSTLPLDTIEAVLGAISSPSASPKHVIAQSKLLSGLPGALRATKVPLARLLEFYIRVVEFGGAQPDARVVETRRSTLADLSELAATLVRDPAASVSLKALSPVIQTAPFPVVASIVAALGEKGADIEAVGEYAALVGGAPAESLAALPPETIVRLMVGSSKSGQVSRNVLNQVATAASTVLGTWGMDDVSKLLFAVAQVKDGATNAGVAELFRKASDVVAPQLASLSLTQLIKVVMAVSRVPASKPLLQAAAAVTAEKAAEVPAAQLIPLTQGLAPVGPTDPSMARLLDFWATNIEGAATEKLSADQLAKLAQVLAPVAPSHAALWAGLGKRLSGQAKSLTAAGQASVSAAFPGGAGPDFEGKQDLLAAVAKLQAPPEKDKRGDDDKRDRDRDRDRKGDRDDRGDRDRDRRSRERDRDRKDRSRSRRRR